MATKKQKHAAAIAKREEFLRQVKEQGLMAQEYGKKREAERQEAAARSAREINEYYKGFIDRRTPGDWADARQADSAMKKRKTSFYSEQQGRPVNAETIGKENREATLDDLKLIVARDLDEWAGLRGPETD